MKEINPVGKGRVSEREVDWHEIVWSNKFVVRRQIKVNI